MSILEIHHFSVVNPCVEALLSSFFWWISTRDALFLDQPVFPEPDGDLGPGGERQFAQDAADVDFHGVLAEVQRFGDLAVALAGSDLERTGSSPTSSRADAPSTTPPRSCRQGPQGSSLPATRLSPHQRVENAVGTCAGISPPL